MYRSQLDFNKISKALTDAAKIVSTDTLASQQAIEQLNDAKQQYWEALSFKLTHN